MKDTIPQSAALRLQLAAMAGNEPYDSLTELRWRPAGQSGMRQEFMYCQAHKATAERVRALADRGDVFIGAAPRARRQGTADAIERSWALWVDIDQTDAMSRLEAFEPAPSIVLLTGSPGHALALWPLRSALAPAHLVRANRRLAHALAGDLAATDPARIVRVPATSNFKHSPPAPVACVRLELDVFTAREVVGHLADLDEPKRRAPVVTRDLDDDDALRMIAPTVYVPLLLGRQLGRDGKTSCPFHDDRTPSLHAYDTPERGWTCYGCGRGGTIVDFGAALYGIEPRGRGFHDIRRRLAADLLGARRCAA